jgi:DNA-binding transcriptional ArsR family regulator
MTLFTLSARDELLAVRFACSPVWETVAAVRTFVDDRGRTYHLPWHRLVRSRLAELELAPVFALHPVRGYIPDFLTPPPQTPWPKLRDQLAEIRATPAAQVARELEMCRDTVQDRNAIKLIDLMLEHPERSRDMLASRIHDAWLELVAPFWPAVRTLLERDIEQRARTLAHHGLRRVVDELDPNIRWTDDGITVADREDVSVDVGTRGLVLMPSAYVWPSLVAIVDEPWQPTIVYPVRGIAELWQVPAPPPHALARLLGRTRAIVLASLDRPISTTALAAALELSPAGASRHLLALRDAGLVTTARHGHEVRYSRTKLGSELLRAGTG